MERLLKYLLPVIASIALWSCMDVPMSDVCAEASAQAVFKADTCQPATITETESELCLPRQVSFADSHRLQNTARRTAGAGKSSTELIRSGRTVNAGVRYSVQRKSILTHSILIEPAHRLLCIGKLII